MTAHLDYLGFSAQRCPAQGGLSHRCSSTQNTENEKYSLHCTTSKVAGVAWIRGDAPKSQAVSCPGKVHARYQNQCPEMAVYRQNTGSTAIICTFPHYENGTVVTGE